MSKIITNNTINKHPNLIQSNKTNQFQQSQQLNRKNNK